MRPVRVQGARGGEIIKLLDERRAKTVQKTVKTFQKNKFQEIRVGVTEYEGNDLIDIRTWSQRPGAEDKTPTSKGISINVKLYPELKEAVLALEKELKDNNFI